MKRIVCLWVLVLNLIGMAFAQLPENTTRNVVATVDANEIINPGEFQMELSKGAFYSDENGNPWFSFVYTFTNKFTRNSNIMVNDRERFVNRNVDVRTYKIGPTFEKGVFVVKNIGTAESDMGSGMEVVLANGVSHPVCDSVVYLNDDGYVYSVNRKYFYSVYKDVYDNQTEPKPVVWPERKIYDAEHIMFSGEKATAFARLNTGSVYFESPEGHYYYLYRDKYMPNTVMVVDNTVYELFDVYGENDLKFKFSYNGQHWMAVGRDCYWIDGTLRSVEGFVITDFLVNDEGHYAYKAYKKDAAENGEVVVVDSQIIRRNAKVCYFALNSDGRFKFRFLTGTGRILQYESEKISDITESLSSVLYSSDATDGQLITVFSNDGKHKLTYRRGLSGVEIDGVKITETVPCYAVYDVHNKSFLWNAIENADGRTELVIYRYAIVNKFFKF